MSQKGNDYDNEERKQEIVMEYYGMRAQGETVCMEEENQQGICQSSEREITIKYNNISV